MANIESVLCSLPRNASWLYNHRPTTGSKEDQMMEVLKNPKDWAKCPPKPEPETAGLSQVLPPAPGDAQVDPAGGGGGSG